MIHIRAASAPLAQRPIGAGYAGPETYRESTEFATADGVVQVGIWEYKGRLESVNHYENHQLWIVLSGSLSVAMDDQVVEAAAGDVVMFEAPYGPKTVVASDGFRAVWVAALAR